MADTPGIHKQEIKLFYCYAQEDKDMRDELQVHLAGLRRQYQLTNWCDREILPGENWEAAIDQHLSTADVILLLISPHFVDSDYCYGKEMQHALERYHTGTCCVIPILLRPTYWEGTPLGTIQMLPTDAKPITRWPDRDEAFHDVAREIGIAIKAMLAACLLKTKAKEEWLKEGNAFYDLKQYEEALTAFNHAIHLDPNDAFAQSMKGATLGDLKRYEEALTAFNHAIRLNPTDAFTYGMKGYALRALGRRKEAIQAFDAARQLCNNSPAVQVIAKIDTH